MKLAEYSQTGNSISLSKIDGTPFTITAIEDSNYEENQGVIITTQEKIGIDGKGWDKFHTTRKAVVNALSNPKLREDMIMNNQTLGPVVCLKKKTKGGFPCFVLEDYTGAL